MGFTKTRPVLVNRRGQKRVIEVRRESNTEIMQDSLNANGIIPLRVMVQIRDSHGRYFGWQGEAVLRAAKSIKEAREFVKRLKEFVEE